MAERMWLDDTGEDEYDPTRRRRPGRILAMATIPWLVVAALLLLPGRLADDDAETDGDSARSEVTLTHEGADHGADEDGSPDADGHTDDALVGSDPALADPQLGTASPELWLEELRSGWRVAGGNEEVAALGVVIARAWLTGIDPVLEIAGLAPVSELGYAEHLVVEAVEQPTPEAAVVTVLAVLLDAGPAGFEASVRRLAVPIAIHPDGPRPAGAPWWLPGPSLEPLLPALAPLDDAAEHLAAIDAVAAAGWPDAELIGLSRTTGWPVVAEIAVTDVDGIRRPIQVWLRRHLDGFVVAGTTLAAAIPGDATDDVTDQERRTQERRTQGAEQQEQTP